MSNRNTALAALFVVIVICGTLPAPVLAESSYESMYKMFTMKSYPGVKPLGMFKNYIIGLMQTPLGDNDIVAVDVYDDNVHFLAVAESIGLDTAALRFWKGDNYFVLVDNKLAVIWDSDLRQVGRFAQDNLKGIAILPNGDLVAWSNEVVSFAKYDGYVNIKQYDVWNATYYYFLNETIKPRDLLAIYGKNPDQLESEWLKELMDTVTANNGSLLGSPSFTYKYDLEAITAAEIRHKLIVNIVGAGYFNGVVYAAVNIQILDKVTLDAVYEVREGDSVKVVQYKKEEVFPVNLGALVKVMDSTTVLEELYASVEASAVSAIMAYVYVPLLSDTTIPRVLTMILEDGTKVKVPVYTSSEVTDVYLVGDYELVRTASNLLLIYKRDSLLMSLIATRVADYGEVGGAIYLLYMNTIGGLELGTWDEYSGRFSKYVLEVAQPVIGVWLENDLLFVSVSEGGRAAVHVGTLKDLAEVLVAVTDPFGNLISEVMSGSVRVTYGRLVYMLSVDVNPVSLKVPPGSTIELYVEVPYGKGHYTYIVNAPGRYEFKPVVWRMLTPGSVDVTQVPAVFYNPFSREFVMLSDTDILKYKLPGAVSVDAYGSYVALIETPAPSSYTSRLSVYTASGEKVFSIDLPGLLGEVKFYYPYIVVSGDDRIYVVDVAAGSITEELDLPMTGYILDSKQEYLSVWNKETVAVVDLRRHTATYLDMSKYGTVLFAPVINGILYAYVMGLNGAANVYVINVATKGVAEILPWDGVAVLSYASDGVFHAVSYVTRGNKTVTDVLSLDNGIVRIECDGQVTWVKDLGTVVNAPGASELIGNRFAAVAIKRFADAYVYLVGMNYKLSQVIPLSRESFAKFSLSFIGAVQIAVNASPVIVLKDYSGVSRVAIVTAIVPNLLAVSENLIAYGDANAVYLVPNPKVIGKYQIRIHVYDERAKPLNATLKLKEFNIDVVAKDGTFTAYLSTPGTYHIEVSAPHYDPKEVVAMVNDTSPAALITVMLNPTLYKLTVRVTMPDGKEVTYGTVEITGVDVSFEKKIDLSSEKPVVSVRKGTYSISYTSDLHQAANVTLDIDSDREVLLLTNRTAVRVTIKVTDEGGAPIANAKVSLTAATFERTCSTDKSGILVMVVPYGQEFTLTATYPGYTSFKKSYNATEELEKTPISVVLRKIRGLLTIVLQSEDGSPESGNVLIKDSAGNIVRSLAVSQMTNVELDLGVYIVEGTTSDGRTASTTVSITSDMPQGVATLVFPKKPAPLYVQIFPYLLIAVMAASVGVIVYRRFIRKRKPKVVK